MESYAPYATRARNIVQKSSKNVQYFGQGCTINVVKFHYLVGLASVSEVINSWYLRFFKFTAMSTPLWIAFSIILAEVGFLISYPLMYILFRSRIVLVSLATRKNIGFRALPYIMGFIAGCAGGFCALSILFLIRGYAGLTENWHIVLNIFLIFYGQVQYLGQTLKAIASGTAPALGWPGILIRTL
jgi:hypothetical protein